MHIYLQTSKLNFKKTIICIILITQLTFFLQSSILYLLWFAGWRRREEEKGNYHWYEYWVNINGVELVKIFLQPSKKQHNLGYPLKMCHGNCKSCRSWSLCFNFCISFVVWFMASFLYCFPYSYQSTNYCDSS